MSRIHPVSPRRALKALGKLGFKVVRRRGSHVILKHNDGRVTVVPVHPGEDIGRGLLRKIAYDVGLSLQEFFMFIKKDP
ncbi:MAG: type II toxin-antitoxin system HicA family toxin [archaeon GB-1867-005]|nr:type II toxin-antitoxin system HicA family toxin [Candidatus Culexmicrobium cathedralense]